MMDVLEIIYIYIFPVFSSGLGEVQCIVNTLVVGLAAGNIHDPSSILGRPEKQSEHGMEWDERRVHLGTWQ